MFFSVIVPIFNAEKTLVRCLDSLRHQTFEDFQVVLIDDGSSDASAMICEQYVQIDKRFAYVRQENKGVSAARNAGMDYAKGAFITFLDSDDIYFENYLSEFYKLILKYPDHDSYWCGFQFISSNKKQNGVKCIFSLEEVVSLVDRKEVMTLHEKILDASPVNKVYKKSIIHAKGLAMEIGLSLGEDLLFNYEYLDACQEAEIVILNKPLYGYFCFSDDSLNHKYRSDLKEIYDKLDESTLEYLKKWEISQEQLTKYYNTMFYRMENVLRNTFKRECELSIREKYKFNNAVMRGLKFKQALDMSECNIHPLYRFAYQSTNYHLVRIVDFLVKCKGYLVGMEKWRRKRGN